MAQKADLTIEEKIRRDGSLSEERKTELLRLVSTMKPEMTKSRKSRSDVKGLIKSSEHSAHEPTREERHNRLKKTK